MNLPEIAITNDTELHHRIMQLKALSFEQEQAISHNVREVVYSMHPAVLVKKVIKDFSDDGEAGGSLASAAVNLGKDFMIAKLFGRNDTLKGFLTSMLVKKSHRLRDQQASRPGGQRHR